MAGRMSHSVRAFGMTDVGLVRDANEDSFTMAELSKPQRWQGGAPAEWPRASALRPTNPFFDPAPVRLYRANNFDLVFFSDPDWVEKMRGIETLARFHRLSEFVDLVRSFEHEYGTDDSTDE